MNSQEDSPSKGSSQRKITKDSIIEFLEKYPGLEFSPFSIDQGIFETFGTRKKRSTIIKALRRGLKQGIFFQAKDSGYYSLTRYHFAELAKELPKFFSLERPFGFHDLHAYAKFPGIYNDFTKKHLPSKWRKTKGKSLFFVRNGKIERYGDYSITIYPNDTVQITCKNHNKPFIHTDDYINFFSFMENLLEEHINEKNLIEEFWIGQRHINQDDNNIYYTGPEIKGSKAFKGVGLATYRKGNGTRFEERVSNEKTPWREAGKLLELNSMTPNEAAMLLAQETSHLQTPSILLALHKDLEEFRKERKTDTSILMYEHKTTRNILKETKVLQNRIEKSIAGIKDIKQKRSGRINKRFSAEEIEAIRLYALKIKHETGGRFAKIAKLFNCSTSTVHKYCKDVLKR